MNVNVWNIKDLFSVPPGAGINKTVKRNTASSNHSSQSDSQPLFSSQLCPDSSQQGPLDYNTQTKYLKNSNQNSQDSELSAYQKYQAKPPLCNIDPHEPFQPFGLVKSKDIIEQFEESKKKAKEKHESERLNQVVTNIQETLQDLKVPFINLEETTNLRCQSILDSINAVSKAAQEKISFYYDSILKAVPLKSDLNQAILDLQKKVQLKDAEVTDLRSSVQLLLMALDAIKLQQNEKHLELSEKLAQLSDFMQSSEDRILSEIRNNILASGPACGSKDETTQTSPISVRDLSVTEDPPSWCKTISARPDGPVPSPANISCTCGGNPSIREVKGRKAINVTSARSVGDPSADQRRWKNAITMADTFAHNLQYLGQDGRRMPIHQDSSPQNTDLYSEKENQVIVTRSKGKQNTSKRPKKSRRCLKKKGAKNAIQIHSRADNSILAPGNEPDSQQRANSSQDCFTLFSQSCGLSSFAVTPTPLRKAQKKKKSLNFIVLGSQQIIEGSERKGASAGDRSRFGKTERELGCETSSWDDSHCRKCEEDKMGWFPSSSPVRGYNTTHPAQKTDLKDLLSLFTDSSDTD
ncbi:interactor of HORMAD1 protein 1 [Leptodactylus fuscus]